MRRTQHENSQPFYENMWFWIAVVILFFLLATFVGHKSNNQNTSSGSAEDTTSTNQLTVGYDDYKVKASKAYTINYSNSDWDEANVNIKKATVYKLDHPYKVEVSGDKKEEVTGFIKLNMSVKALNDISIYPTQATANFKNEQAEAMGSDTWDGDINRGAEKSGTVYFPIKKLKNVSSISSIRLTFDGHNQKHIMDDHDYDVTINLTGGKSKSNSNSNTDDTQSNDSHVIKTSNTETAVQHVAKEQHDDNSSSQSSGKKDNDKVVIDGHSFHHQNFYDGDNNYDMLVGDNGEGELTEWAVNSPTGQQDPNMQSKVNAIYGH